MTNLYQYSETEPPTFSTTEVVTLHDKVVGWVGYSDNREASAYLSRRDPEEHRFHKLDGYAVSNTILDALKRRGIDRVLIAEVTGDVYEYARKDFDRGVSIQFEEDDPQRCVPVEKALNVWPHLSGAILP